MWGTVGAVGGFFAGAFAGYGLDRGVFDRNAKGEDPGMKGLVIGAVSGSILLSFFLVRVGP
jgi:hypothetical protein